jgi:hypothetical protein
VQYGTATDCVDENCTRQRKFFAEISRRIDLEYVRQNAIDRS